MNRNDFDDRLVVAAANTLLRTHDSEIGLVRAIHSRLLDSLDEPRRVGRSQSRASVDKRRVIREFNKVVADLLQRIQSSLAEIRDSGCLFAMEERRVDENVDEEFWLSLSFDDVFEFQFLDRHLRAAKKVRFLAPMQQLLLCDCLRLQDQVNFSRQMVSYEDEAGSPSKGQRWRERMGDELSSLSRARARLAKNSHRIFSLLSRDDHFYSHALLSIDVPVGGTSEELVLIAGWYENTAEAMYQPYQLDGHSSVDRTVRCQKALEFYLEAGEAYSLLGAWLRCLASIDDHRRCRICYRHLGRGLKHFCRTHARSSAERQATRELHISDVYRPVVASFLAETREMTAIGKVQPSALLVSRMQLECRNLPEQLIVPAALLAALIRGLWPVVTAVLEAQIQSHFTLLLEAMSEPFGVHHFATFEDKAYNAKARERATRQLSWETFFRTWFGSPIPLRRNVEEDLWRDVDHPAARGQMVSPTQIAADLAHYRVWTLANETFDQYAYLNLATVSDLRVRRDLGGGLRSHADIGKILGVSAEAIRRTLQYSASSSSEKPRRERIVPRGVERANAAIVALERASRVGDWAEGYV